MVETKVKASTAAAALAGLALWALGRYVFKGTVPDVVASWVYVAVPSVITFGAGYLAKHTNRPAAPAALSALPPGYPPSTKLVDPPAPVPASPAAPAPEPPAAPGPGM